MQTVVVGEQAHLWAEVDRAIEGSVRVTFVPSWGDPPELGTSWQATLTAEPAPRPEGCTHALAYRIPWQVSLPPGLPRRSLTLTCEVRVTYLDPPNPNLTSIIAAGRPQLRVGVVAITDHPALSRIMLHEHAREQGGQAVLDGEPLAAYADGLSVAQRKLLFRTDPRHPEHRLVAFATLAPRNELRMGADFAPGGCVKPNATFAVFHRDAVRDEVTLVCYTRYFLVNGGVATREPQAGIPPSEWLRRDNPRPPRFALLALLPYGEGTSGLVWNRIVTPGGRDVLLGNTLHGIINTHGCWMLFRNFNWPREVFVDLDRIYRTLHRPGAGKKAVVEALARVGYDGEGESEGQSTSYDKFLLYDRNFAYQWFMHDVVGVRYLSHDYSYASRASGPFDAGRRVHDHRTDGLSFAARFPLDQVWKTPPGNTAQEGDHAYHDVARRHADDHAHGRPPLAIDDGLLGDNVLGFRTAKRFCKAITGAVSADDAEACSWADLYFYRDDELDLGDWRPVYEEAAALDVVVVDDEGGRPIAGAEVVLRLHERVRRGRTNRFGVAHFLDLRPGSATVLVTSAQHADGEARQPVVPGEGNRLTVRQRRTDRVAVEGLRVGIRRDDGAAVIGAEVRVHRRQGGLVAAHVSDAAGEVDLSALAAGDYEVRASHAEALGTSALRVDAGDVGAGPMGAPPGQSPPVIVRVTAPNVRSARITRLFFSNEHLMIYDNDINWTGPHNERSLEQPAYTDFGACHWRPGMAVAAPMSVSMGQSVTADLVIELDAPVAADTEILVRGSTVADTEGFLRFEQKATIAAGRRSETVKLWSEEKVPGVVQVRKRSMKWSVQLSPPSGRVLDLGVTRDHEVFITLDKPVDEKKHCEDGVTLKRLRHAVNEVGLRGLFSSHGLAHELMKPFLRYQLRHIDGAPASHPGFIDLKAGGAWLIAERPRASGECQAIVRYVRGILKQIGARGQIEPWMVYALPDAPTKAVPKPLDLKGGLQPITKLGSNGKVWQAALSDTKVDSSMIDRRFAFGDLGLNAFEACLVVNAIDSDGNDRTTYYAPGTGAIRFDSPQAVLGVFEALVWVELVGPPDSPQDFHLREIVHKYH